MSSACPVGHAATQPHSFADARTMELLETHFVRLLSACRRPEAADIPTPFSLFDMDRIRHNCSELRSAPRPGALRLTIHFALKSQYLRPVLDEITRLVDGLDVQSEHEIQLTPPQFPLSFHSPVLPPSVLSNPRIRAVSLNSATQIEAARTSGRRGIRWGLRVALPPSVDGQFVADNDKFGLAHDQIPAMLDLMQGLATEPVFLHHHTHARLHRLSDARNVVQRFARVVRWVEAATTRTVRAVNLGGGWDGGFECRFGDGNAREILAEQLRTLHAELPGVEEVIIEPGRALVEDACAVVATVLDTLDRGTTTYVVVDVATGFLITVPLARFRFIPLEARGGRPTIEREVVVVDGTCSSRGRIASMRCDWRFRIGERLAILNTGGYTYSLAGGFYCLPPPAYALGHDGISQLTSGSQSRRDACHALYG
jgi:diaminopimelate decarboxylase